MNDEKCTFIKFNDYSNILFEVYILAFKWLYNMYLRILFILILNNKNNTVVLTILEITRTHTQKKKRKKEQNRLSF